MEEVPTATDNASSQRVFSVHVNGVRREFTATVDSDRTTKISMLQILEWKDLDDLFQNQVLPRIDRLVAWLRSFEEPSVHGREYCPPESLSESDQHTSMDVMFVFVTMCVYINDVKFPLRVEKKQRMNVFTGKPMPVPTTMTRGVCLTNTSLACLFNHPIKAEQAKKSLVQVLYDPRSV